MGNKGERVTDKDKIAIQIREQHMERLKRIAAARGITIEEAVEQALEQSFKNTFGKPN
jgi:predicted DNA binding CopG/RHH family protein